MMRTVLNVRRLSDPLNEFEIAVAAVYEWLAHTGLLSDAQMRYVLSKFGTALGRQIERRAATWGEESPPMLLTIAEGRWVSWTGTTHWLDFLYEDEVETTDEPAVTLIVCDINSLMLRTWSYLKKLGDTDAHGSEHHASEAGGQPG